MDFKELQSYNFVSMQMLCCTEIASVMKTIPDLFPQHHVCRVDNPLRRVDFRHSVRMGELEAKIHGLIYKTQKDIKKHGRLFSNFIPWFNIRWMQQYKIVSPYLIDEATELFKQTDLLIFHLREDIYGRKGDLSWYARPNAKTKDFEETISYDLAKLISDNNIKYITVNKLLKIAQRGR